MTENIENLVLEHLRAMRADISKIKDDTSEIKSRITSLETAMSRVLRDTSSQYGDIIENQHRYDKLADRIERIERRLEIA